MTEAPRPDTSAEAWTACSRHRETVGLHVPGCDLCVIAQLRAELQEVKTAAEANRKHWEDQHCALLEIMEADRTKAQEDDAFNTDSLEAARKNGKTVCDQRDELRGEVSHLKLQLERYWARHNKSRRYSYLWKEHAKELQARIRQLEGKARQAEDLLEQREGAYELLWENYQRDQTIRAACEECWEECQGMVRFSTDESDSYWELAELLMSLTSQRLGVALLRAPEAPEAPDDPNPGV